MHDCNFLRVECECLLDHHGGVLPLLVLLLQLLLKVSRELDDLSIVPPLRGVVVDTPRATDVDASDESDVIAEPREAIVHVPFVVGQVEQVVPVA